MDSFWLWFDRAVTVMSSVALLAGVVFVVKVWLRARRIQGGTTAGRLLVIDFGGHSHVESEDAWASGAEILKRPLHVPRMDDVGAMRRYIEKEIEALPQTARARIAAGDKNIVFAYPSPIGAVLTLDTLLHSLLGYFPRSTWPVLIDGVHTWVKPVDRQVMHSQVRTLRWKSIARDLPNPPVGDQSGLDGSDREQTETSVG